MFSLAHDENIEVWIDLVDRHLHLCPEANTLSAIALLNNITLAQVFMKNLRLNSVQVADTQTP